MRNVQKEKGRSMTVRISANTEQKFGIIWNILQSYEPPQIRLSRNDVFETMVKEYYQICKKDNYILMKEQE